MINQSRYHTKNRLIEYFKEKGKAKEIKSSDCLVHVGEKCNKAFFILNGGFVCQNYNEDTDKLRTINFHLKDFHPIMTVVHSFYSDSASNCQLRAIVKSEVLEVRKSTFLSDMKKDKTLQEAYIEETIYALLAINEFHTRLITLDTKAMYRYLQQKCPIVVQNIPAKYIAEFMGVSAEWLSRIR